MSDYLFTSVIIAWASLMLIFSASTLPATTPIIPLI